MGIAIWLIMRVLWGITLGAALYYIGVYRKERKLGLMGGVACIMSSILGGLILLLIVLYSFIIAIAIADRKGGPKDRTARYTAIKEHRMPVTAQDIVIYSGPIMAIYCKKDLSGFGDAGIILAIHEFLQKNNIETRDEFDFNAACRNIKEYLKTETVSKESDK